MKFKVISRSETKHTRERRDDVLKVQRNPDPQLHPFEQGREYTRALNAAKLQKVFARPFIGSLDGHMDGVFSLATNSRSLVTVASGSCDGEVKVWDVAHKKNVWSAPGHSGFVRGLSVTNGGSLFYSCGDDKTIKKWQFMPEGKVSSPLEIIKAIYPVQGIDCHWSEDKFVTCGATLDIWEDSKTEPLHTFKWGADSITSVKFNPAERNLIGSTGSDRSITLYDSRAATPLRKMVLSMRSNAIAWNPMEPFMLAAANEDHNCYSFDIRKFSRPLHIHKDHVSAVMDISFSPTGKDFVTGSYDRTVRLFKSNEPRSYNVYHTRRMQRVFCARFTADAKFVLSGSDDTNIRIWKAKANQKLGQALPRQQAHAEYSEKLLERYKHAKEIKRIVRHRHVPKAILKATEKKREMEAAVQLRHKRRKKHAKEGTVKTVSARDKPLVKVLE
mmetsp:Transcript_7514/g.9039  ORF Transcript_7514/g.9039 Transcript_7514/m.9039 type:complete len:444 (-) Transcript_7514:1473-2804(-)